ncbi:switch-associated protein 70-like [Liolophura sinensis]|uniref:switch-associated protein 70-like n=1 Tax=Liolophura sinensis TaxID=3198878 RepID=UPI00315813A1
MDLDFEESKKCIWHAFDVLDEQNTGTVSRSKLKVLTHNLANAVGIEGMEEQIQEETLILDFNDYQEFIDNQLFTNLKKTLTDTENNVRSSASPESIDQVCWVLCARKYSNRAAAKLNDKDSMLMWKVFNFLAEQGASESQLELPLRIDVEEVKFVLKRFADFTGNPYEPEKLDAAVGDTLTLDFLSFLQAFETVALNNLKPSEISRGVNDVYEELIKEVIKKGMMSKKGHRVTNWKERWIVLTPTSLRYYANKGTAAKDLKGELPVTHQASVESQDEKPGAKLHRFTFHAYGRKPYEFCTPDLKTKNEWIRALQTAIEYSSKPGQVQRVAKAERRQLREDKRNQLSEEERRRREEQEMIERQRSELESEREARAQLEARYAEEAARREAFFAKLKEIERLREEEQRRLAELEKKYQDEVADRKSNLRNLRELQEKYEEEAAAREAHMKKVQELEDMCQAEERKLQELESKYHDESSQREADLRRLKDLEQKYQEEAALREMDQQKLRELEEVRQELERLLEEERTARKDEEVVRCLQGKLLEEESMKREELVRLHKQQMALRVVEQQEREGLEEEKNRQEELLQEARAQLERLERERKAADEKLMEATSKLEEAQLERVKAQEKARLWSTPIGLARPIQPEPKPWITHRGEGAFIEADFHKFLMKGNAKLSSSPESEEPKKQEGDDFASTEIITPDSKYDMDLDGNQYEKQNSSNHEGKENISQKVDDVSDIEVTDKQCEREQEHRTTDVTCAEDRRTTDEIHGEDHVMTYTHDTMVDDTREMENIPKDDPYEKCDVKIDEREEKDEVKIDDAYNKEAT